MCTATCTTGKFESKDVRLLKSVVRSMRNTHDIGGFGQDTVVGLKAAGEVSPVKNGTTVLSNSLFIYVFLRIKGPAEASVFAKARFALVGIKAIVVARISGNLENFIAAPSLLSTSLNGQ